MSEQRFLFKTFFGSGIYFFRLEPKFSLKIFLKGTVMNYVYFRLEPIFSLKTFFRNKIHEFLKVRPNIFI